MSNTVDFLLDCPDDVTELVHDSDEGGGGQAQLRVTRNEIITDGLDKIEGSNVDDNEHISETHQARRVNKGSLFHCQLV